MLPAGRMSTSRDRARGSTYRHGIRTGPAPWAANTRATLEATSMAILVPVAAVLQGPVGYGTSLLCMIGLMYVIDGYAGANLTFVPRLPPGLGIPMRNGSVSSHL